MAYTDATKIKNALERDLTADETASLTMLIPAVKQCIDNFTGRIFEKTDEEARYFDSDGERELFIDEAISITTVEIIDSAGDVADEITKYYAYPLNSVPKTYLRRISGAFPNRVKSMKITGIWGYSETAPEGIESVATQLIVSLFTNKEGLKSESIEGYSRAFNDELAANPIIRETLQGFVRVQI